MARNTLSKKDLKELRRASGLPGSKRTVFLLGGLTVLALLAILGFACLMAGGGITPNDRGLLPVGSQAPDFSADMVDGGKVSLGDSGDYQATLLVFFASWCPHCNREAPLISDLKNEHEDDLRVIMAGIDSKDDSSKVGEFVNKYGIEGPALYDPSLGTTYQVSGYPTMYVIDKSGKIVAAQSGEAPQGALESWIGQTLGNSDGSGG